MKGMSLSRAVVFQLSGSGNITERRLPPAVSLMLKQEELSFLKNLSTQMSLALLREPKKDRGAQWRKKALASRKSSTLVYPLCLVGWNEWFCT